MTLVCTFFFSYKNKNVLLNNGRWRPFQPTLRRNVGETGADAASAESLLIAESERGGPVFDGESLAGSLSTASDTAERIFDPIVGRCPHIGRVTALLNRKANGDCANNWFFFVIRLAGQKPRPFGTSTMELRAREPRGESLTRRLVASREFPQSRRSADTLRP